jgi:hypothetical protein
VITKLILPSNGSDVPQGPHVPGTAELHVYSATGGCSFVAVDGAPCGDDHRGGLSTRPAARTTWELRGRNDETHQ